MVRQVQAFGALEADWAHLEANGGICAVSLNALIAALANGRQLPEAEEQLQRAVCMATDRGYPLKPLSFQSNFAEYNSPGKSIGKRVGAT